MPPPDSWYFSVDPPTSVADVEALTGHIAAEWVDGRWVRWMRSLPAVRGVPEPRSEEDEEEDDEEDYYEGDEMDAEGEEDADGEEDFAIAPPSQILPHGHPDNVMSSDYGEEPESEEEDPSAGSGDDYGEPMIVDKPKQPQPQQQQQQQSYSPPQAQPAAEAPPPASYTNGGDIIVPISIPPAPVLPSPLQAAPYAAENHLHHSRAPFTFPAPQPPQHLYQQAYQSPQHQPLQPQQAQQQQQQPQQPQQQQYPPGDYSVY